jgi:hypothetical protein
MNEVTRATWSEMPTYNKAVGEWRERTALWNARKLVMRPSTAGSLAPPVRPAKPSVPRLLSKEALTKAVERARALAEKEREQASTRHVRKRTTAGAFSPTQAGRQLAVPGALSSP